MSVFIIFLVNLRALVEHKYTSSSIDQTNRPTFLLILFFLLFHTFVNVPSCTQLDKVSASTKIYAANADPSVDYKLTIPASKRPKRILVVSLLVRSTDR